MAAGFVIHARVGNLNPGRNFARQWVVQIDVDVLAASSPKKITSGGGGGEMDGASGCE